MKNYFTLLIISILLSATIKSQTTIFPFASSWKYLDNGTNQGTSWREVSYSDAAWKSGNGQLGYGDADETTKVGYGPDAANKYITTYFRKTINIANPTAYSNFAAGVQRDDGVVVYVNGVEVYRNNLPSGTITYTTLGDAASDDGDVPQPFNIAPSAFVAGNNVIAVEIHQFSASNSDISFDMELKASGTQPPPSNTPPTVNITSPANNASYAAPATVAISANAGDVDGTVSSVAFYNGSSLLGTDNSSPYSFSWTNVAADSYSLTAKATDNLGAITTSAPVAISVSGTTPPPPANFTLTRGPYLNLALQTSIVIRWRTDVSTNSKVMYGTAAGSLSQSVTDNTSTKEHIVTLTGLTPNTQYYYSIGSTTGTLQGNSSNYFKTMPVVGSTQKIRIMAMGDMGLNSTLQKDVRDAWIAFNANRYTDIWMLLGDNAYSEGTDAQYQTKFFGVYQGSLTKNHVLWPVPGNHDYASSSSRQADHNIPYYSIFTLPRNGEAGGVASNTEAFYSYNYANVHFVALDSYGWETGNTRLYDTTGPQVAWLKRDLAANTQPWIVVYFHHPPYTKGSHDSDSESELTKMHQRLVPILERYKVDLVLNGHSHSYERVGSPGTELEFAL